MRGIIIAYPYTAEPTKCEDVFVDGVDWSSPHRDFVRNCSLLRVMHASLPENEAFEGWVIVSEEEAMKYEPQIFKTTQLGEGRK